MKKIIPVLGFICMLILSIFLFVSANAVTSASVISLKIESYPDRTVYGAFELLDKSGLVLSATLSDGSTRRIMGDEIDVGYNRDGCFRVGDRSVRLFYGGQAVDLPITVNRIEYDLSALSLDSISTIYNGRFQSYSELLPKIVGLDGIPLRMTALGGSVDAGTYDISIDFYTESKDYITPETRLVTMTVFPLEVETVWEGLSFTYDGKSKLPSAYFVDVYGQRVDLSVIGSATNAGQGYTATALLSNGNYSLRNATASFEIKKADYDMSAVRWSEDSFVYDGSKKGVTVTGLPAGVSVIGYSGERATDAGKYTAIANLSWDKLNYNPPETATHSWEILAADYDMSGVRFDGAGYTYDGDMHYPKLIGKMPVGADGIALEYSFSAGARNVNDGTVSVIISFKSKSKNYNIPKDVYSSVYITPMEIEVRWGSLSLTYSGEAQYPSASSDKCRINVVGEGVGVGKYTARAMAESGNYHIINDSVEFTIERATNFWSVTPVASRCFEGRELAITGQSRFGEVAYIFYSDPDCNNRIDKPTACGKYYVSLSVEGTENYEGIGDIVVPFEIVKIEPISFLAVISSIEGLRAFDRLTEKNLICSVINNDGSHGEVDISEVTVIYENGDAFRRGDSRVTIKYGQFSLTLPVEVGYADYDTSGVRWINTTVIYNGQQNTPTIIGLPEGIRIVDYLGGGVTEAGKYKVYVNVEYDAANYNAPKLPICDFTIEKCPVNIPYISAVYNGGEIIPLPDNELYLITSEKGYTNAGKYTLNVRLVDEDNYVFEENSKSIANAIFEILPATVVVEVSDVRLHLFEPIGEADYKITAGQIFGKDSLPVTAYREGDKLYLRSENPNYVLLANPGRITRLPYPTIEGGIIIGFAVLILFIIAFMIKLLYTNKEELTRRLSMAECRWKNRSFKARDPKRVEGIRTVEDDEREREIVNRIIAENDHRDYGNEDFSKRFGITDFEIDAQHADMLITDSLAKSLLRKEGDVIYTSGNSRGIINVDTLSENFAVGDIIDVNRLKDKGLIDGQVAYIKVLARGRIDKPLTVYANDFSPSAVKMIALTGGKAIKVITKHIREKG